MPKHAGKYPFRKEIAVSASMLVAIDEWRGRQRPVPTANEAVRRLIELGLQSPAPQPQDDGEAG